MTHSASVTFRASTIGPTKFFLDGQIKLALKELAKYNKLLRESREALAKGGHFDPIPVLGNAIHYAEFQQLVKTRKIDLRTVKTFWGVADGMSQLLARDEKPEWATHVICIPR